MPTDETTSAASAPSPEEEEREEYAAEYDTDLEEDDDKVIIVQGNNRTQVTSILPTGMWVLIIGAFASLSLWGLGQFASILAPAFLAFTLVLTIRPIHRWMVRKGVPKWLSAISSILVLVVVLSGLIGITVIAFLPLPEVIASYQASFTQIINNISRFFTDNEFLASQGYDAASINNLLNQLDLNTIMSAARTLIDQISSMGALLAIIAMSIFFIVIDTLTMDSRSNLVEKANPDLHEALSGFEGRVRQYWLVSTIFGAIVAVFDWIALEAMGIPLALAWALVSFITNYIPNIGFILGLVPPALFGLLEGGWQLMLWVIVAYSLINFIIQSLLQPKFTADAVGLSTTVTFLSLMIWGIVIGPLGALLAVPLTLFFKAVLVDSSKSTRWLDAFLTSEHEVKRKQGAGRYDVTYESPDAWGGLQTVVTKAARGLRRPARKKSKLVTMGKKLRRRGKHRE
ncbi:MAG: AI-2E family transporter [Flaviflexus sp.]|uniref:AI-2E family transporter n=1 Tax=Flaviflexus sp. TaxID=1969482 RepID=UPI00352F118B